MIVKAALTDGKGQLSIEDIELGEPGYDEVMVQIKASGICHTDHDSLHWGRQLIPGHEGA